MTPDPFTAKAHEVVDGFVSTRPEYRVDAVQPDYRGGTNRIILGTRDDARVVFKVFATRERWRNEAFCLRHFAAQGIVPAVWTPCPSG